MSEVNFLGQILSSLAYGGSSAVKTLRLETQPLCCLEGVFTALLNSNGSYSIVACIFIAAGMCLPSRCLTTNVSSDFTIPAFGRHVTICIFPIIYKTTVDPLIVVSMAPVPVSTWSDALETQQLYC
jgi:hypothetical protein